MSKKITPHELSQRLTRMSDAEATAILRSAGMDADAVAAGWRRLAKHINERFPGANLPLDRKPVRVALVNSVGTAGALSLRLVQPDGDVKSSTALKYELRRSGFAAGDFATIVPDPPEAKGGDHECG